MSQARPMQTLRLAAATILCLAITTATGRSQPYTSDPNSSGQYAPPPASDPDDPNDGAQYGRPYEPPPPPIGAPSPDMAASQPSQSTPEPALPPPAAYGAMCDTGPDSCSLIRAAPLGARCVCPGYGRPTYGTVR